jgi:hypothetical protein
MIYLLYSKSELNFSNIWRGHLEVVKEALLAGGTEFKLISCNNAIDQRFGQCDVVINFGNHQYLGSAMLKALARSLQDIGRTVFFMDDYQAPPATQMRKAVAKACNLLITNISEPIERK